jgi:hypothetical protein
VVGGCAAFENNGAKPMKAGEARHRTAKAMARHTIKKVYDAIAQSADLGHTNVVLGRDVMSSDHVELLEADGYRVAEDWEPEDYHRNRFTGWTISWGL